METRIATVNDVGEVHLRNVPRPADRTGAEEVCVGSEARHTRRPGRQEIIYGPEIDDETPERM
eukprot:3281545-Rhodomonas_salina.1